MKNTPKLWSDGIKSSIALELPEPINPFDKYHDLRLSIKRETQNIVYKRLGDRTYRLFVTNQALQEVTHQYSKGGI